MARKRRKTPRVPRSRPTGVAPRQSEPAAATAPARPAAGTPSSRNAVVTDYSHVKRDLMRIALFGALIFGGMIGLRIVGI